MAREPGTLPARAGAPGRARADCPPAMALLGALFEGALVWDATGRLVWLNAAAEAALGPPGGREAPWDLRRPDGTPLAGDQLPWTRALGGATCPPVEYRVRVGRRARVVEISAGPVRDRTGRIRQALALVRDVTARRQADARRAAADRARAAAVDGARAAAVDRAREELALTVAHELRTPLAGARLLLEAFSLEAEGLAGLDLACVRRFTRLLTAELDQLSSRLRGLVEGCRAGGGHLAAGRPPVRVATLVQAVAERLGAALEQEHPLTVAADPPARDALVAGDAGRLDQVLTNLLTNAAKYSPVGSPIRVDCRVHGSRVHITVADSGPGIPPALRERVFERFFRVPRPGGRDPGGLGLGLHLAREIVLRHGGRIWVDDAPGGGAAFHVVLPLAPAHACLAL